MRNFTTFTAITLALGLSATTPMSLAGQSDETKPTTGLVQMTDSQMDTVTAGALINLFDVASHNQVQVAVPVNAAVAAGILGGVGAAAATQPGNITQRH